MLRYSLGAPGAADRVEGAVERVIAGGPRTRDLGGTAGTAEVRAALLEALR